MKILDGRFVAQKLRTQQMDRVQKISSSLGRVPHLAVVLVGEDPASQIYVKNKHLACGQVGIESSVLNLSGGISQEDFLKTLAGLNDDPRVDAVLVQLPLPPQLEPHWVAELLSPDKDADALTYASLGKLLCGRALVKSCTPFGIMKILEHYGVELKQRRAVVIGRSLIVGKPMALLLTEAQATVSVCHSKTKDIKAYTQEADLVVVAAGKPKFFGKDYFREGAVVVDVGIHRGLDGKLCGDVDPLGLETWLEACTPVPGGVGPMTIACLIENTLSLAEAKL